MKNIRLLIAFMIITMTAVTTELKAQAEQEKFSLGGFMALNLIVMDYEKGKSMIKGLDIEDNGPRFTQSNLNLYFMYNTHNNWSAFTEIKFLYLLSGFKYEADEGIYSVPQTSTYTDEMLKEYQVGGIFIERAYIEYNRFEFAKVRFGRFLTPYGIFSQDHGAPAIISVRPPVIVLPAGDNGMPQNQTGAELLGTFYLADFGFEYAAYISNGPSEDPNANGDNVMCRGAFLNLIMPTLFKMIDIEFGGAVYQGKRTFTSGNYIGMDFLPDESQDRFELKQRELITSAHAKLSVSDLPLDGKLLIQSEYLKQKVTDKIAAPIFFPSTTQDIGDYDDDVMYVQFEYQMYSMFTPYFRYERQAVSNDKGASMMVVTGTIQYVGGLNIKPIPNVSLKFEALQAYLKQIERYDSNMNNDFRMYSFQVSMAFM